MSRYRKVEVKTWADEKFRRLSPMPPSGQGLWLFLMTGPHTGPIPGLFRAGRASMAEELGWELEAFDKAFAEVFGQGMAKANFNARLVWLPKAIRYNKPESPNVVRSWRAELDALPECELKREAIETMRAELESFGSSYAQAFDEAIAWEPSKTSAKASPKASDKPSSKAMANQKQEQEQEKRKARGKPRSVPLPADFGISDRVQQWAHERGYTRLAERLEHFIGYAKANGKRYTDWDQAFMNAIRDDWAKLGPPANVNGTANSGPPILNLDDMLRVQGLTS